jgi:Tol biopolymer transport system component
MSLSGTVSTNVSTVQCAKITFINEKDTTLQFTVFTDSIGKYTVELATSFIAPEDMLPVSMELAQNYPNPFTSSTSIPYKITSKSDVKITIYDILGREVRQLANESKNPGEYCTYWDGKTKLGKKASTGIYICRLKAGNETQVKKMILGMNEQISFSSSSKPLFSSSSQIVNNTIKTTDSYSIKISNSSSTKPKITTTTFSNYKIASDTTIDFLVKENIMQYSFCYNKDWNICLNNNTGSNYYNFTDFMSGVDYNPQWSPDGKYIAYDHRKNYLYLYDTMNDTCFEFLSSSIYSATSPHWIPDSKKLIYRYHIIGNEREWHVINLDGSNDKKINHFPEYFFSDNYTFIYADSGKVYKSNLDNSYDEMIVDLNDQGEQVGSDLIQDFNPIDKEFLFCCRDTNNINYIKSYNLDYEEIKVILLGDTLYSFPIVKWSPDYSIMLFMEGRETYADSSYDQYLSILEDGEPYRLLRIGLYDNPNGLSYFSWETPKFSPDGKYIAYGTLFMDDDNWVTLHRDLYYINISSGEIQYIDACTNYSWNPLKHH